MIDQRKLLTIFLFVTGMQLGVVAQTFSIRADRIEYIDPDTHNLISLTAELETIKMIELSRIDNYFAIHFPELDSSTGQSFNYFFKLYTSRVPDDWLSFEEQLRLVGL